MNRMTRLLQTYVPVVLLATLTWLTDVRAEDARTEDARTEDPADEYASQDYKAAYEEYNKGHYEEARNYCEFARKKSERDTPGIRILVALLDIQTGKPKTGSDALQKEIKPAEDERERLQKKFDGARAGKSSGGQRMSAADLKDLQAHLKRADDRVVQIKAGLKRAADLMAKVYITVPPEARDRTLVVRLDKKPVEQRYWDGKEFIEVDSGFHTLEAFTGAKEDVRMSTQEEANAQKPLRFTVRLSSIAQRYPVAGFLKLRQEMDDKVKWLADRSDEAARNRDKKRSCYEDAWKELTFVSANAEDLAEGAGQPAPADAEDHHEVAKIRRLIQYELLPCMDDCLQGRGVCDMKKDVPMRVWPARGCGACTVGAGASDEPAETGAFDLFIAFVGLTLFVARVRRRNYRPTVEAS